MMMKRIIVALCLLGAVTFAESKVATPAKQDSVQMCPCPEKKGLWAKAKQWVSDHPEQAVAVGTTVANVAAAGYVATHNCDRYHILIEYMLMDACIQNCGDAKKCAERIDEWECKQKIKPEEAEVKNKSCPMK